MLNKDTILTTEQIEFLDKVGVNGNNWSLNVDGEVDVECRVDMRDMNLTEIPVKFGTVKGWFNCENNKLTSMKNFPKVIVYGNLQMANNNISNFDYYPSILMSNDTVMSISENPLNDYFKNIKEEDFPYWSILNWWSSIRCYPFLINITKKYLDITTLKKYLNSLPQTKLYLKD